MYTKASVRPRAARGRRIKVVARCVLNASLPPLAILASCGGIALWIVAVDGPGRYVALPVLLAGAAIGLKILVDQWPPGSIAVAASCTGLVWNAGCQGYRPRFVRIRWKDVVAARLIGEHEDQGVLLTLVAEKPHPLGKRFGEKLRGQLERLLGPLDGANVLLLCDEDWDWQPAELVRVVDALATGR